jgi:hypothetical protein
MFDLAQGQSGTFAFPIERWRRRVQNRIERLARAWSYFIGRLSAEDAQQIILDCRCPAGWHPLLTLTVEDTLEEARETFADHPDLPWLIAEGCIHVERKWESYNDDLHEARCWAIELAQHYAVEDSITLVRRDNEGNAP